MSRSRERRVRDAKVCRAIDANTMRCISNCNLSLIAAKAWKSLVESSMRCVAKVSFVKGERVRASFDRRSRLRPRVNSLAASAPGQGNGGQLLMLLL